MKNFPALAAVVFCFFLIAAGVSPKQKPRILVFSKTAGYYHQSIPKGIVTIQKLGAENNFVIDTTSNAAYFNDDNLSKYAAVIFLNTTGKFFNDSQRVALERYMQAGGGFAGIHAAADAEYEWPWYNKLVGAYFLSHPEQQEAELHIKDAHHLATRTLPPVWKRKDEWYNFKQVVPGIKILITVDEKTYTGGKNGDVHPIAWYHAVEAGRSFYTALGHTTESYDESIFQQHLLGGIQYVIGKNKKLNYKKVIAQYPAAVQ
ncbi:MAG: ThuA domain-containing protein [Ferruginibacter sp.]